MMDKTPRSPVLLGVVSTLCTLYMPACLGDDDVATAGEVALTEATTDEDDDSTTDNQGTEGIETSTAGSTTQGEGEGDATAGESHCDADPECGPDETVDNCPEQCSVCGDGVVSGDEDCDNGTNESATHYYYKPSSAACAPGCRHVDWCGDGIVNGPEPCDDAHKQTSGCEIDCSIPRCGDSLVNPKHGEACDDANNEDGDGCTADCTGVERRVFISRLRVGSDFNFNSDNPDKLSGITLADFRCNIFATKAKLPGTYKAWLSDSETSPKERFDTSFTGVYRLARGGPIVARGWDDLTDGSIAVPIDLDAYGNLANLQDEWDLENPFNGGLVWSNTAADGTRESDSHCEDWTSKAALATTALGLIGAVDESWSTVIDGQSCAGEARFYCFEDPTSE